MTFVNCCNYVETGGDRRQHRKAFDVVPHIQCETSYSGHLCAEDMMGDVHKNFFITSTDYCIW